MHHFIAFWSGRPERMLAGVERVLPRWSASVPGWGAVLACRAFANEECGNYVVAEASGREALMLDPGNLWATHAVAHVMEMQGRRGEGIRFLDGLEQHWEGGNAITHHLWWHRAMYHLERREFGEALGLYDRRFRDLDSPLVQAMPDFTIDVQNAASMLFRLELHGVEVGDRWVELADKAEARIGDHLSPFTLPHRMMALAATGRWAAAERMLEALREAARANRARTRAGAARCCAAGLRGGAGAPPRRLRGRGGGHAPGARGDVPAGRQPRAAGRAGAALPRRRGEGGLDEDVRLLLERVAGQHPVPPERRVGYAERSGTRRIEAPGGADRGGKRPACAPPSNGARPRKIVQVRAARQRITRGAPVGLSGLRRAAAPRRDRRRLTASYGPSFRGAARRISSI